MFKYTSFQSQLIVKTWFPWSESDESLLIPNLWLEIKDWYKTICNYEVNVSLYLLMSYIIVQVTHTNTGPDNINLFVIPVIKFAITRKYFRPILAITGIAYSVQQME